MTLVIFDLDDTLIDTSHVYYMARKSFLDVLAEAGVDPGESLEVFEDIDSENTLRFGFVPERYGLSMKQTVHRLCSSSRREFGRDLDRKIEWCGRIVLDTYPELIEGARELLEWVSRRFRIALLTRGVFDLQMRKLEKAGLRQYFERVEVTDAKDAHLFRALIQEMGQTASETWVVGDTIKSDVNPGLEAGARCILFHYSHPTYVWRQEYGEEAKGLFYRASSLAEVREILESPESFRMIAALL